MTTKHQIQMAARLYEARDAARRLLGAKYPATIQPLVAGLQRLADATTEGNVLSAAIRAARNLTGTDALLVLAAAVECVEPEGVAA